MPQGSLPLSHPSFVGTLPTGWIERMTGMESNAKKTHLPRRIYLTRVPKDPDLIWGKTLPTICGKRPISICRAHSIVRNDGSQTVKQAGGGHEVSSQTQRKPQIPTYRHTSPGNQRCAPARTGGAPAQDPHPPPRGGGPPHH